MFTGSLVALITPFKNGSVDEKGFEKFVGWQIKEGTDGLVPCGTTGESPTLSMEEHKRVIDICIATAKSTGVPVIAGTGSNSTAEAIELTQHAKQAGADVAMLVVPYYNKPTQEGLYRHFKAIAEAVDLPMFLYNVPGRTGADLANDTALRLAQVPGIVGIKDATGNIERGSDLLKRAPQGFTVLSGDDATALALTLLGGKGTISVTANVAPRLMHEMIAAALAGDVARARTINFRLLGLHKNLFLEANPIPVKWACARMGLTEHGQRLPLTSLSPEFHDKLLTAMHEAGIDA